MRGLIEQRRVEPAELIEDSDDIEVLDSYHAALARVLLTLPPLHAPALADRVVGQGDRG